MDLDADGHDDVISGSYWPGDMFWFRGQGGGKYAAGAKFKDASGKDLNAGGKWKSDSEPDMESLAAAPHAADLDGDGDVDLLVGNIAGHVVLIPNEGTRTEPKFVGANRSQLKAGGGEVTVGGGDAGPSVVDWDGDGLLDLVVGAGDGSVWLHRNEGTKQQPRFAKGESLVDSSGGHGAVEHGKQPTGPGSRSKVCVTDYDGDGRLDLLVGDFASTTLPEPKLDAAQTKRRDALQAEQEEINEEWAKLRVEGGAGDDDPKVIALSERLSKIYEELRPLTAGHESHGWVWLFKRKPATKTARD